MKILIVRLFPYEMNIHGYNVQEIGLAKALVRKGYECDIAFYTKGKDREEKIKVDNNKEITIFWIKGTNFLKNGLYGNKIIKLSEKYDIVQSSEYDQIHNLRLAKKIGNKLIIYHGPYYCKFNKGYNLKCKIFDNIFLKVNRRYKKIPIITKSTLATNFLKEKGFKRVTTIGVGLDDDNFIENRNIEENQVVATLKQNKLDSKYLLYIGKLEERRNTKKLFKIFQKVYEQRENTKLIVVGKGEEDYIKECFNYADELNIKNNIIYIPSLKQNELSSLYKICDIFILPTSYEIFGMVLLEAMYEKLPVITTANGGSTTIIEQGKNGFIYELNDEEKIVNKIYGILNNDEYKNKIGNNASMTIKEKFLWSKLVDKFIKEYNANFK